MYPRVLERAEIEMRSRGKNGDHGNARNGHRMRLHRIQTACEIFVAATMGSGHSCTTAMSLHFMAAGALLRIHRCAGKSACHSRSEQDQNEREYQGRMACALHSSSKISTPHRIGKRAIARHIPYRKASPGPAGCIGVPNEAFVAEFVLGL